MLPMSIVRDQRHHNAGPTYNMKDELSLERMRRRLVDLLVAKTIHLVYLEGCNFFHLFDTNPAFERVTPA
jgi:hypothetical protein